MSSNNNLRFLNFTLPRSTQSFTSINRDLNSEADNGQFPAINATFRGSLMIGQSGPTASNPAHPADLMYRKTNHFHSVQELNNQEKAVINGLAKTIRLREKQTSRDESHMRKFRQSNNFSIGYPAATASNNQQQPLPRTQSQKMISSLNDLNISSQPRSKVDQQRIFVVRHGERVDSTFGVNWLDVVFDSNGKYRRINLNLPRVIPQRKNPKDFIFDPPLTELGLMHSRLIGEELEACGTQIKYCYSSPALRCVQTAAKILEGLQRTDIAIRIEPCLFEFLKWHPVMPLKSPFMDIDELRNNGFNVDKSYKTIYPLESLRKDEDEAMYYTRSHTVMLQIIRNHELKTRRSATDVDQIADNDNASGTKPENILIVGHAPTLEVATRQLTGGSPRVTDLKFLVRQIPYLSIQTVERQTDGSWKLRKPPIPPMKHGAVEPFDWRYMR